MKVERKKNLKKKGRGGEMRTGGWESVSGLKERREKGREREGKERKGEDREKSKEKEKRKIRKRKLQEVGSMDV